MSNFESSRLQDSLRADVPHASSYSDMDGDALSDQNYDVGFNNENPEQDRTSESMGSHSAEQPSLEHVQSIYYTKGLEEIENLQLLDLSPLATWRLSSYKDGHGLAQLREDSPETYWQSDGTMENNVEHLANSDTSQLSHPHHIMLQFSKKVSLERISIFTNYQFDESYTPLKIKIMAGGSNWDLKEVCVVSFDKPMGWSHIVFKGVRGDGLLKCFVVKIIILANHQDGKDSHIRALRCFGKKSNISSIATSFPDPLAHRRGHAASSEYSDERETSINNQGIQAGLLKEELHSAMADDGEGEGDSNVIFDPATSQILSNVSDVLGFNLGFESLELKSISSIR